MDCKFSIIRKEFLSTLVSLSSKYGKSATIRFAVYEDDESLRYFRPMEDWPGGASEHRDIMSRIQKDAIMLGYKCELRTISTSAYWRWLAEENLKDNPESRSQFISL